MAKRKPGKRPNIISAPRPPAAMRSREGFIRWEWSRWIGTSKIKQSVAIESGWKPDEQINKFMEIETKPSKIISLPSLRDPSNATVDTSEIQQTPFFWKSKDHLQNKIGVFTTDHFLVGNSNHPKIEDYFLLLVGLTSATSQELGYLTIDELGYPSDQRISESTTGPSSHRISMDFPMLHEELQSPWSFAVVNLRIFHWKLHPDATTNMRLWTPKYCFDGLLHCWS